MICSDEPDTEVPCSANASCIPTLEQAFSGAELDELVELNSLRHCFFLLGPTKPDTLPFAAIVEQLFSSTFYTALWTSCWAGPASDWLGEPLAYTVTHTPFRKFKAVLPWLSAACQGSIFLDCLCAELLASLFYLYDDVLDTRTMRYGKETAYSRFGRKGMEYSWARAHQLDLPAAAPFFQGDNERRRLWEKSLDEFAASERLHISEQDSLSFRAYRDRSARRTGFLGEWWQLAATRAGNDELSRVLDKVYPLCAFVGQIRNDLCNIDVREQQNGGIRFSDFTDGRITAVTILVREWVKESASSQDRSWLQHEVWRSKRILRPDEMARLSVMCHRSQTIELLTSITDNSIQRIKEAINTSALSEDLKALWSGWVFRQFHVRVTGPYWDGDSSARQFIQAVRRLNRHDEWTVNERPTLNCALPSAT